MGLWEMDHKEGRTSKNWCLQTAVLEKTPESPLRQQGDQISQSGRSRRDQPWIFTGRTDAGAEAPVFWSSNDKRQLIGKVPEAGKDWWQKEKRTSEDEMAGCHHWCKEHELGQSPGDGEGQGGLVCCSPCGRRVRHDWVTEQ